MPTTDTDHSCDEHSDCTVTIYTREDGTELGRRHLHQWVDEAGLWGRDPNEVVVGALNVGVLLDDDHFDPEATVLVAASGPDDPATRLNETYPWADDHRTGKKVKVKGARKALPKPPAPPAPKSSKK